ncbi:MAG: sigma-E processing peptidase SpoIIGA [Firmicutes bacterium]|nr:sigma-E processing peptidase SpoIIGA [Bacillota bacterium]
MVVYGEILFLENAVTGGLILWLTGILCGRRIRKKKLCFGSILCGLYAFTLFQGEIGIFCSFAQKLIFSMILTRICFGATRLILAWILFYIISFFMGGATLGMAALFSIPSMALNGSIYMNELSFVHLISGCGSAILTVRLITVLIRERNHDINTRWELDIIYKGRRIQTKGYYDTGNLLTDPLTGLPVCFVTEELIMALAGTEFSKREIVFSGADGEKRTIPVFQPDYIAIYHGKNSYRYPVILAIVSKERQKQWGKECSVLIHSSLLETVGRYREEVKEGIEYENDREVMFF